MAGLEGEDFSKVQAWIKRNKVTVTEFCDLAGISATTYSLMKHGKRPRFTWRTKIQMARNLGVEDATRLSVASLRRPPDRTQPAAADPEA